MRQRVLWGLLAVIIAATIATGHVVLGMVATGVELVLFDVLAVATGLGFLVKSKARDTLAGHGTGAIENAGKPYDLDQIVTALERAIATRADADEQDPSGRM